MDRNYLEELKKLEFEVGPQKEGKRLIKREDYCVGIYDENENPPIKLCNCSIEKVIPVTEILEENKIPYSMETKRPIEELREEILKNQGLLKRLENLKQ